MGILDEQLYKIERDLYERIHIVDDIECHLNTRQVGREK